jgi:hypothetical protein
MARAITIDLIEYERNPSVIGQHVHWLMTKAGVPAAKIEMAMTQLANAAISKLSYPRRFSADNDLKHRIDF